MVSFLIGIFVICVLALIGIMVWDTHRFVVVENTVKSEKIKERVTVVVLADLHNKCYGEGNCRLLEKIDGVRPDLILVAGDMLNAKPETDFSGTAAFLKELAKRYVVLYGIGNHEHRLLLYPDVYGDMGEKYWKDLRDKNIVRLENKRILYEKKGICVYGVQIGKEYYKRFQVRKMEEDYLKRILGEPEEEYFNILLAHNPDYFENYASWGADLVFSGHVHGGIVRLPFLGGVLSPACRLFPKYDCGIYKEKDSMMILSRGLGSHTIPVRLFNPGELHVVYLQPNT